MRQGGVLSPHLFAIYIEDVVKIVISQSVGCYMHHTYTSILLYADDILLLAPSIESLQKLLSVCETALKSLCLTLNYKKTVCMRIGPRYQVNCAHVITLNCTKLDWVQ